MGTVRRWGESGSVGGWPRDSGCLLRPLVEVWKKNTQHITLEFAGNKIYDGASYYQYKNIHVCTCTLFVLGCDQSVVTHSTQLIRDHSDCTMS